MLLRLAASRWRCRERSEAILPGDTVLPLMRRGLCVEVMAGAYGFRELCCGLNQPDVLIAKADRQDPLVIVRPFFAVEAGKRALFHHVTLRNPLSPNRSRHLPCGKRG
jgi:hypothetical protein